MSILFCRICMIITVISSFFIILYSSILNYLKYFDNFEFHNFHHETDETTFQKYPICSELKYFKKNVEEDERNSPLLEIQYLKQIVNGSIYCGKYRTSSFQSFGKRFILFFIFFYKIYVIYLFCFIQINEILTTN
jgi:hypothetical protein